MINQEQTEPYQRKVRSKHRKMKFRLIGLGKNKTKEKGWGRPNYKRSKSAPAIGEDKKATTRKVLKVRITRKKE